MNNLPWNHSCFSDPWSPKSKVSKKIRTYPKYLYRNIKICTILYYCRLTSTNIPKNLPFFPGENRHLFHPEIPDLKSHPVTRSRCQHVPHLQVLQREISIATTIATTTSIAITTHAGLNQWNKWNVTFDIICLYLHLPKTKPLIGKYPSLPVICQSSEKPSLGEPGPAIDAAVFDFLVLRFLQVINGHRQLGKHWTRYPPHPLKTNMASWTNQAF